jgi:hypothetical protein
MGPGVRQGDGREYGAVFSKAAPTTDESVLFSFR